MVKGYYTKRKEKLLKDFEKLEPTFSRKIFQGLTY